MLHTGQKQIKILIPIKFVCYQEKFFFLSYVVFNIVFVLKEAEQRTYT